MTTSCAVVRQRRPSLTRLAASMVDRSVPLALAIVLLSGCRDRSRSTRRPNATSSSTPAPVQTPTPPDTDEDRTVKAIEKLGGQVLRNSDDPARPIIELDLSGAAVADKEMKEMAAMKGLQKLQTVYLVNHHDVTDTGLKDLAGWKDLKKLNLEGTAVTARKGCTMLTRGLKDLTELDLIGTQVTDEGLKELADLKKIRKLKLFGTRVTDAGVAALQKTLPD